MHRARATDVEDPAVGLQQRLMVGGDPELRIARHQLGAAQALVADPVGVHRRRERLQDRLPVGPRLGDVKRAGAVHERYRRLALDDLPRLIGELGQRRVTLGVVGEPDDPRVILGGAQLVAEVVLLQADHPVADGAAQPVRRGRAQPAGPDHRDAIPIAHRRGHYRLTV